MGPGQRRHRHRRPREPVQRIRLLSSCRFAAPTAPCSSRNQLPERLRPASRRRGTIRFASRRCWPRASSSPAVSPPRRTRTTCVISIPSPTPRPKNASSKSPGAARPAPTRTAGWWRSPRRRMAIGGSIRPTPSSTMMQNAKSVADPAQGPSGHGPSAHVLGQGRAGSARRRSATCTAIRSTSTWPGFDPAHIGYVFTLRLRPGETRALMTFVVKGLSEVYDPRGGYPIPFKDGLLTGEAVYAGADAKIPAPVPRSSVSATSRRSW